METVTDFIFLDSKVTADSDCSHEVKRRLLPGRKAMTNLESILQSRDITLLTKVCIIKATVFQVVKYRCENWTVKKTECWRNNPFKLCWRRFLRSLWTAIKPVNLKGNQPWIFIGKTDSGAPIFWTPDVKTQLIGKDPDVGKDWGQEEKGMTEDEMVRKHHWLNGHEFEQTLGDSEGQGSLACYSP